jgi:hypothetical protein
VTFSTSPAGAASARVPATLCDPTLYECPSAADDAGAASCTYLVPVGAVCAGPCDLQAQAGGTGIAVIAGAHDGQGGCAPGAPSTHATVVLPTTYDAGG